VLTSIHRYIFCIPKTCMRCRELVPLAAFAPSGPGLAEEVATIGVTITDHRFAPLEI
jgi:hypothetical protein